MIFSAVGEQGPVEIFVSAPGGHSPKFYAGLAARRIMDVAETAPQPIRDQAYAFRAQMEEVIRQVLVLALDEQKAYKSLEKG